MRSLLRPTNQYAPRAILPGDPQVALELAQALISGPLMANHARGLWGYTGPSCADPEQLLSIQSTGYGGQSAAAVIHQLASLGIERAFRVGTAVALDPGLAPGDHILVRQAVGHDRETRRADAELEAGFEAAHSGALRGGTVASVDTPAAAADIAPGALAVDGASAGLFAAAAALGVPVAAALVIVESGDDVRADEEARAELIELGRTASSALAPPLVGSGRVKPG